MASTTEKVEVELILKAKEFREDLKQASTDANKFNKGLKDVQKAGGKQDKELHKLAKEANKFNKGAAKNAIDHEKELIKLVAKRHSQMRNIKDTGSKEFKEKRKEASDLVDLYTDIKKARIDAEKGEPGSGRASRFGRSLYNGLVTGAQKVTGMAVGALTQRVHEAGAAALQFKAGAINLAGDPEIRGVRDLQTLANIGARDTGYGTEETLAQAAAMSRATGHGADVTTAQQFSRAGMLDMGQATGFMGLQARGGVGGAEAKRDLERIMTNAFANGLEKGRFGEYLEGLTSLVEGAQGRLAGEVSGADYARSLSVLDQSGYSGLRGSRGARVLGQLEQGFMSGGGAAGKAMSLSAMGFGTPGGKSSLYDAEKMMQRGFAGPQGAETMMKMVQNFRDRYGGNSHAAIRAAGAQTGMSYDILEQVFGATGSPGEVLKKIGKLTEGAEPVDKQMLGVLKGELADEAKKQSNLQTELLAQGLQAAPALKEIQAAVNKMIETIWPAALEALKLLASGLTVIATAIKDAMNWWKELPMFKPTPYSEMSFEQRAVHDSKLLTDAVLTEVAAGNLNRSDAIDLLREEEAKNEKARKEHASDKDVAKEYAAAAAAAAEGRVGLGDTNAVSAYSEAAMQEVNAAQRRQDIIDKAKTAKAEAEAAAKKLEERKAYVESEPSRTLYVKDPESVVELKKLNATLTTPKAKGSDPSGKVSPVARSGKPK